MNSLRKIVGLLMVMMLATFAGSSIAAQQKTFYAQVQSSIGAAGSATGSYTVTLFNTSPNPSTINSFLITPPKNGNTPLLTITGVSPGTASPPAADGSVIVNSIPGIGKGANRIFTVTFSNLASGCQLGTTSVNANAGNAYPQGDPFAPDQIPGRMKLTSVIGCDFLGQVTCGDPSGFTVPNGKGPNDSGYANFTVDGLKSGGACPAGTSYTITGTNTLTLDNKLAVKLSDPNAGFTGSIVSNPLPLDAQGYASLRVKVAWVDVPAGSGIFPPGNYINAPTCLCSTPTLNCMPIDNNVPPDPFAGQQVKACVLQYSWDLAGPNFPGLVKYSATILGFGADPAMGWGD